MKILVIRFSSLGDVILTLPAVSALRKRFPDARITYLTKKPYSEILTNHPEIDTVIIEDEAHDKGAGKVFGLRKKLDEEFDLVIDLSSTLKSYILAALLKKKQVLRYKKDAFSRRLFLKTGIRMGNFLHVADRYLATLELLGVTAGDNIPVIVPSEEAEKAAGDFIDGHDFPAGSPLVGMSPLAIWPTKRWPADNYVELARKLIREKNARIILFGSPEEYYELESICSSIGAEAVNASGNDSVLTSASLLKRCRVLITNDSGPMHLASSVGVPVVAFFGPTVKEFGFFPRGPQDVVLEKEMPCRPCSLHGSSSCPENSLACLTGITPLEAYETVSTII